MRRAHALISLLLSAAFFLAACGSSQSVGIGAGGSATTNGNSGGAAGASSTAGSGNGVALAGASNNAGAGGLGDACAETKQVGKLVPLDIFIMLDISASMLEKTGTAANAPTKWAAVTSALDSFLSDPASSGLGVGIQYFPQRDASVPATCNADAQCGTHGPCFLRFCQGITDGFYPCSANADCTATDGSNLGPCVPLRYCYPAVTELTLCHGATECATGERCVPFNECSLNTDYSCPVAGQACGSAAGMNLGDCRAFNPNSVCVHDSACDAPTYSVPAAAIAALPGNLAALRASIMAQMPHGNTPTAPALSGAILAASNWAKAHPDHTVVTLLATDGQPTECIANPTTDPSGIIGVRGVAAAGVAASPSISTFVIGVFGPTDTAARQNLNQIAMAGGSGSAFLIDTTQDVTAQFLAALTSIRSSQLSCEYVLPAAPAGQTLDYSKVNVDFSNGGTSERLASVSNADACGSGEGWYYDQMPSPTKIVICPTTCQRLQAATQGSVQVALGCQTVVR
ncbi:MAG: VWA domain-containing protein [Polyangiaceae bacterium]